MENKFIKTVTGKVMKVQRQNADGEFLYKAFLCHGGCGLPFQTLEGLRDHLSVTHPDLDQAKVQIGSLQPETTPMRVSDMVHFVIAAMLAPGHAIAAVRKPIDGVKANKAWAAAELATPEAIDIDDSTLTWVRDVLKRDMPLTAADKEAGVERQTVASTLFGLNAYACVEAVGG